MVKMSLLDHPLRQQLTGGGDTTIRRLLSLGLVYLFTAASILFSASLTG